VVDFPENSRNRCRRPWEQRGALVEALAQAAPLVIEIAPVGVKIWSGSRLLVHLPPSTAARHARAAAGRAARAG
jgi:hypothetical protein